jgi:outer membrane receptor protein involved in Fe transport
MKLFYTLTLFITSHFIFAQTSILKGTIIDDATGKTMPGVDVSVSNTKFYASSDFDGNFIITNLPVGTYEVQFSTSSYRTKIISEVVVTANDATNLTVSLVESKNELKEVVITRTKAKVESIKSLLTQQKNSVSVSDGISAETIKRTPDKSTSDVLKRISGASIQDNKFVIVRGLNDRYNANYLNGAPLPSSESDRKAFSFDIFPSNMIDNLVITKTATPDLTGEFAGGVIQITTKNIPDQNFQSFSYGNGYNSLATGKTQRYYEGGKTDWLGIDDGTRALPSSIPDTKTFKALTDVSSELTIPYAKAVNSDWELKNKNFSPNVSFQYSLGKRYEIGEKTLGVLFSTSYSKSNVFDSTSRFDYETPGVKIENQNDKNYREQVLLGALANFSLKINKNNNISFKNIFSINSDDRVIERFGERNLLDDPITPYYSSVRWFTSNKIYTGQLLGEHYLSESKIKINWLGSYSKVDRLIPSLRRNIYTLDTNTGIYQAIIPVNTGGTNQGGGIFYSNNNEYSNNGKIDISKKFGNSSTHEIKTGIFYQDRNRDFYARQFHYTKFSKLGVSFDSSLLYSSGFPDDKTIFGPQNIGQISPTLGGFSLYDASSVSDTYTASSNLKAAYLMLDDKFKDFRMVWGLRTEQYRQLLDAESPRKIIALDNKQTDFLPSANLIYALDSKRNLRLSYSKTLNRPEFRELAPFIFYDFTTGLSTQGNSDLKIATIQNYDFRFETFPGKNQLFSVSVFYKNFKNPIEIQATAINKTVRYQNADSGFDYGVEMEFRTQLSSLFHFEGSKLLDNLTVFSNISSISSEVDVTSIVASSNPEKKRQMQGQSPYILNAGIQYADSENGFNVAVNLNRVGNRIAVGGNIESEPALWEKSRTLLDCQFAKTFLNKKMEVKLNIQNILAQDQIFYNNNDAIPFVAAKDNDDLPPTFFTLFDNVSNGVKNIVNRSFGNRKNWYNSETDDLIWKIKTATTFSVSMSYNF